MNEIWLTVAQQEDERMLSLFLNFLMKQALAYPDTELEAYTEAMAAEDDELIVESKED